MAKITRKNQKLFGSSGTATNFGEFGSKALGSPATSKDPDDIQSKSPFTGEGWVAAVLNDNRPCLEDQNGLDYLTFYQLAYLFQAGIAEWNTDTVYYTNSFCQSAGVVYVSLTDNNSGHAVSDPTNWAAYAPFTPTAANAIAGSVVQTVNIQTGTYATGTTQIPLDNTIPQKTEGDEYMTLAITPNSASNKLKITVVFNAGLDASQSLIVALFQDTTANALAAAGPFNILVNASGQLTFTHYMTAGTTSSTTFKVRAGAQGGTVQFNGSNVGGAILGGVVASSITIEEIKV